MNYLEDEKQLIEQATEGNSQALEALLYSVQDMVFNLSLRMLDYLSALEKNNEREWFHGNKEQYQAACGEFERFIGELILELHGIDERIPLMGAKELTFKLMRDTRFSKDKSPYNPAFRAHIGPKGKLPVPVGYFISISPVNRSFFGGGMFGDMFRDATTMMRDYITDHGAEWQAIISDPQFTACFQVQGTALKKVPQGYDPAHPQAQHLKNKSWYLEYPVSDTALMEKDMVKEAIRVFRVMKPFNDYMNKALKGFSMPTR